MSKCVTIGCEIIDGYEVASDPFNTREEAYKELDSGNWPAEIYKVRYHRGVRYYEGAWYIMARKA